MIDKVWIVLDYLFVAFVGFGFDELRVVRCSTCVRDRARSDVWLESVSPATSV